MRSFASGSARPTSCPSGGGYPVAVGTFKKNPASMLARRDVPDTGQHILP
jgi:hypothetical protein